MRARRLQSILRDLIDPAARREAARVLAERLGAEDLIIFIEDPELGLVLPAPGFPQTLPGGRSWQAFLADSRASGRSTAELSLADAAVTRPVSGVRVDESSVLVLIGGAPRLGDVAELLDLLALAAAALRSERDALTASGRAATAEAAREEHRALAQTLDQARGELQHGLAERERQLEAERRGSADLRFLADASAVLGSSLDYESVLTELAELAVQAFEDCCCIVDVIEGGRVVRVNVAVSDPARRELAEALAGVGLDRRTPHLVHEALAAGRSVLLPQLRTDVLESMAQSPEHLELLRRLDPRSFIVVPMVARERVVGAMAFFTSKAGRRFDAGDLKLVEEIANRAALALDNAYLYREARRAIEARESLLAVVSHDLRNPLSTLHMSIALLLEALPKGDTSGRKLAEMVQRSARRMERLIEDLLDFAAIDAGELKVERLPRQANSLVSEAVESQQALAAQKFQAISALVEGADTAVLCDFERVQQIFANLISNATKFTPEGGSITVRAEPGPNEVRFSVADTGPGIPREQLQRLFEPYWQAKTTGGAGLGLGLFIAKGIAEAHGGRMWVESDVGAGTTFFFTLPVASAAASADRESLPLAPAIRPDASL